MKKLIVITIGFIVTGFYLISCHKSTSNKVVEFKAMDTILSSNITAQDSEFDAWCHKWEIRLSKGQSLNLDSIVGEKILNHSKIK